MEKKRKEGEKTRIRRGKRKRQKSGGVQRRGNRRELSLVPCHSASAEAEAVVTRIFRGGGGGRGLSSCPDLPFSPPPSPPFLSLPP